MTKYTATKHCAARRAKAEGRRRKADAERTLFLLPPSTFLLRQIACVCLAREV